jgi:hypothetical protein
MLKLNNQDNEFVKTDKLLLNESGNFSEYNDLLGVYTTQ